MGIKAAFFLFILFTQTIILQAEGLQIITSGGYQGIADSRGTVLVAPIYEALGWSDGGSAITREAIGYREDGKWGLINIKDKKVTSAKYTVLKPFGEGYLEAGITGRFSNLIFRGLIDVKAKVHLDFRYFSIEPFTADRLLVAEYSDGQLQYGLYNYSNERVIEITYYSVKLKGDLILAENAIKKYRIYNLNGELVMDDWVDDLEITPFGYLIKNEGKVGLLSKSGAVIHETVYKQVNDQSKVVPYPEWEIRSLNGDDKMKVACDSVVYYSKNEILIAHVNDVTHILGASATLFKDQQHNLRYAGNGFLVTQNVALGTWGIYKTDGKEVASGYDSIVADTSYFYAQTSKGWFVYNFFGRKVNKRPYESVGPSQNLDIPVKQGGYWGWMDFQGEQQIDFKFDDIRGIGLDTHFAADYLDHWGISTLNGKWIILPEYDDVQVISIYYVARRGMAHHIYSFQGDIIARLPYQVANKGFLQLEQDGKYGLVTSEGTVIDPKYDEVGRVGDFYVLQAAGKLKLIDASGREIVKPEDEISAVIDYSDGFFLVRKDGKYGFVDENGKLRVANRYDDALAYHEGLAPVSLLGRWGFIDKYENLVIQPHYKYSSTFENALAIVQVGKNFGLINRKGEETMDVKWKHIERLPTGNYLITDWDDKKGLADARGNFILRPNFDELEDTQQSLVIATKAGKKGVLDYQGFTKVSLVYDEVKIEGEYLLLLKNRN